MAKDLPSFIAKEGATREGAVIRERNFIDANNYETVKRLETELGGYHAEPRPRLSADVQIVREQIGK